MRREPLSPDDRAMEQATGLRKNAHGVEQEAFVGTLLAVPEAKRTAFTHPRARQAGRNAATESVVLSVSDVLDAVPTYPSTANEFEAGWNAHHKRAMDDVSRLRGALVASRRRGDVTVAPPGALLADGTVAELIYRLWALIDLDHPCAWSAEDRTCEVHPLHSGEADVCDHDLARTLLTRLGLDPVSEQISQLWGEAQARREHVEALAAELPEEGDASAAQQ